MSSDVPPSAPSREYAASDYPDRARALGHGIERVGALQVGAFQEDVRSGARQAATEWRSKRLNQHKNGVRIVITRER